MKPTHKKIIRGPGGIKCPCCRLGRNCLRQTRILLNRRTRRIDKQNIKGQGGE